MKFDYSLEPGKKLDEIRKYKKIDEPVVTIIIPFYNDKAYIEQSINSVLNQTFPYYECLIIDDGSTDEESLKILEKIEKIDDRIKVFHKENQGLSATRDYGATKSKESCKYLLFLDSDDVIEKTYIECAYWTLETNKKAAWAYTDSVGFGASEYLWNKWFDSEKMKKINDLVATALIRKEAYLEVNGYELREKAVNEDWNFWLKLIAKGKYPVHMSYYGFWYRRKEQGELIKAKDNQKRALQIINDTAKTIKKPVTAVQYPKQDYKWDGIVEEVEGIKKVFYEKDEKINILMMFPWMVVGGADKFNLDLVSRLDKNKYRITILLTEPNKQVYRQEFEKYATVYDLTSFLDAKYWISFINNLISKENIDIIFNTNCKFGYSALPYLKAKHPEVGIIDYIHMEEWYNRNGGYSRDSSAVSSVIDKTYVCNKNTENILVDHFKRNPNDIETVYIGANVKEFNPDLYDAKKILEKYQIRLDKKYRIGFICRIAEQKRPMLLLQIIKRLKEERNDFLFIIAGDGNLLKKVKSEAKALKIIENIQFLGNVTQTKEIYKISDLTLNCSIKEGVALTTYESLSMGVPVISSDVGGQKELINDEVGVIVPCLQDEIDIFNFVYEKEEVENYVVAINKVLNQLDHYKNKCRKRILEGFTIEHMIEKMSNVFDNEYKNKNEQKIKNAKALQGNIDIMKELINLYFITNQSEYKWLCDEYNRIFYGEIETAKRSILKEKLWEIPLWRVFIKTLQKMGIIKGLKKVLGKI